MPTLDYLQNFLDFTSIGMDVTGVGVAVSWIPDVLNGGISAARGDVVGAVLSVLAALPFVGNAANAARIKRGAGICGKGGKAAKGGAKTPIGRRGNPMKVPRGTNSPKKINGRDYTGHALDQMQGRGIMPSAVDDAIRHGGVRGGVPGTTAHYSSVNNVTVITDTASGRVITVGSGRFGG